MSRDNSAPLDIAKAARLIAEFTQLQSEAKFTNDLLVQSSVLYQITVMGESTKKLSRDFRETHPYIPWKLIAGMRDKVVHDYNEVNLQLVWGTATIDVLNFLNSIEPLLPQQN